MDIASSLLITGSNLASRQVIEPKSMSNDKCNNKDMKCKTFIKPINRVGRDIYHSRQFREGYKTIHKIANDRYELSQNYKETGIVPNYLNKLNDMENQGKIIRSQIDDIQYNTTGDINYDQNRSRFIFHNGKVMCNQVGGGKPKVNTNVTIDKSKLKKLLQTISSESDSEFSESESNGFKSVDSAVAKNHTELFNRTLSLNDKNKILNNKVRQRSQSLPQTRSFIDQYDDMRYNANSPTALNRYSDVFDDDFSKFQSGGNMTYGVVDSDKMEHNNMVPSFKSKGTYGGTTTAVDDQMNYLKTRKVELFSGSANNLDYRPKKERKSLFNPIVGLTNQFGMPNFTDYQEQYYIPSRYRNNEKPFQEIKVTPGLGLGYNEVNKGGLGETFRTQYPTVDELRVASNPKTSYGPFPVIKNNQQPGNRSNLPDMKKRKPATFFELDKPINGMGEMRAPKIEGEFNIPLTARSQTTKEWKGPAKFAQTADLSIPEEMMAKVKLASRQNFKPDRAGAGGAGTGQLEKQQGFDYNSAIPDVTNRSIYNKYDRVGSGAIGTSALSKSQAFDAVSNMPSITMRSLTGGADRVGNALGNSQLQKSHAFNMNDVPDANMRNLHSLNDRAGNIGTGTFEKPIAWNFVNSVPETTMRDLSSIAERAGMATGTSQMNKAIAVDYNDVPDVTLRSVFNKNDRAGTGALGIGQHTKGQVIDYKDTPNITMRSLTGNNNRAGVAMGTAALSKSHVFNPNDAPNITIRSLTGNNNRAGAAMGTAALSKSHVFNPNDAPNITMRSLTSNNDRAGIAMGTSALSKGQAWDPNDILDPTNRSMYNLNDRAGASIGNSVYAKAKTIDFNDRPDETNRSMNPNTDRAGNIGNMQYQKPHAFDFFSNRPDPTLKEIYVENQRAGQVGNSALYKPTPFDKDANTPNMTQRAMFSKNNWLGPAGTEEKSKQASRSDFNNAMLNLSKEASLLNRAPTKCNYSKGPTFEHTIVQLSNPLQINRELYPDIKHDVRTRAPVTLTRHGNILPQQSWRFYSHVDDNIKNNPFINNMIHQAGLNA